jgi:NDP-sugar pyrophosphorylase family protein
MQALIFAAGLGTRLYPLTKDRPKALVEVMGKPLLQHAIENLQSVGINDIVVNVHHFADKIVQFLSDHDNFGLNIQVSKEEELLETAGGLAFAKPLFNTNEDILLYNADVLTGISLKDLIEKHQEEKPLATLSVRMRDTSRYLLFNDRFELSGWTNTNTGEKRFCRPPACGFSAFAFSGIHIVSPHVFNLLGEPRKRSLTDFYLEQGENHNIIGLRQEDEYWFDCGKVEKIEAAENYLKGL